MVWGKDDCALAIANIDCSVLGIDTAAEWRGRYKTERGAKRLLRRETLVGALRRAARRHHWLRAKPISCPSGSRGVVITPLGPTTVIKYDKFWVARSDRGFAAFSDNEIKYAWVVG